MESNYIIINGVKHVLKQAQDLRYCLTCSLYTKCHIRRQICGIFGAAAHWHFEVEE